MSVENPYLWVMDRLLRINEFAQTTIGQLCRKIEAFAEAWEDRADLSPDQLSRLRELATVQSIGSSTRIEGVRLTDAEIEEFLQNMTVQKLQSRDQQEVVGYFDTLQIILENFEHIELTTNLIRGLHKQLLQHSTKDERHRGNYKALTNEVVATLPDGSQRGVFQTTSPMRTPDAMEAAVRWYGAHIGGGQFHELVVIGAFVYEFLTIHPFQDGNGRLSRLLTTLLLLKNGYEFIQYTSLEQEIEAYKADYYKSLLRAQRYRETERETIESWLIFFLRAVERATKRLAQDRGYLAAESPALYLNRRQRSVLRYFDRHDTLSVGDIHRLLPEESRNTLKVDLAKMTKAGLLVRRGRGRGTVYQSVARTEFTAI